jgi:hypothetical protein
VAGELFLPLEFATWKRDRLLLKRGAGGLARSRVSGVRLQEWDRTGANPSREAQCQSDVRRLVHSVRALRARPHLERLVLSRDLLRSRTANDPHVSRMKFGLRVPEHERFAADAEAAKACHRSIVRSVRKAGLVIEAPREFAPATGLDGLEQWASALRLRKRWRPSPRWLLLLPLLLLPFLVQRCAPQESFFGVPIESESFIIVVDRSSSMAPHLQAVQDELRTTLARMRASSGPRYVDVIAFAGGAESVLGQITPLDDQVAARLSTAIDTLQTQGGTNLETAMVKAAEEVRAHGKPTTLIVLTDGQDESIPRMLERMPDVERSFGGVRVSTHTTTPRLFAGGDATPQDQYERELGRFSTALHGRFGPSRELTRKDP